MKKKKRGGGGGGGGEEERGAQGCEVLISSHPKWPLAD
jgi:hypothetical protein